MIMGWEVTSKVIISSPLHGSYGVHHEVPSRIRLDRFPNKNAIKVIQVMVFRCLSWS